MRMGLKTELLIGATFCLIAISPAAAQPQTPRSSVAELTRQTEEAERQRDEASQRATELREQLRQAEIEDARAAIRQAEATQVREQARLASLVARAAVQPSQNSPPPVEETDPSTVVTETTRPDGTRVVERRPITQADLADDDDNRQTFGGIEFGVGMAFSLDLGDRDRVRDVQLVGPTRVVRVSRGDNVRARLILESHYFFTPEGHLPARLFGICNPPPPSSSEAAREASTCRSEQAMWGWGPFIAVQPGSDNIIDAIGAGLMIGLRRPGEGSQSFNIGVGILYDMDVQLLGDGIVENEPLPDGEADVRFRREAQSGLMVMSSYSF